MYKLVFKSLGLVEVLFSTRLQLFDQKYNKNSNIMKKILQMKVAVFYFNIFFKIIYSCDSKAELSAGNFQCLMIIQKSFWYSKICKSKNILTT